MIIYGKFSILTILHGYAHTWIWFYLKVPHLLELGHVSLLTIIFVFLFKLLIFCGKLTDVFVFVF